MLRPLIAAIAMALTTAADAQVPPFSADFKIQEIATNGTTIHVRIGGSGPAVVLLHGMGRPATCGRPWRPTSPAIIP